MPLRKPRGGRAPPATEATSAAASETTSQFEAAPVVPPAREQVAAGSEASEALEAKPSITPGTLPQIEPTAPSVARLDTLQHTPLGAPTGARGGSSARRPIARPRGIGRRSQKDRVELEKAESERKKLEAEAKEREDAHKRRVEAVRGRGAARGRVRGGYMGESERRNEGSTAPSGPFSLGEVTAEVTRKRPQLGGERRARGGGATASSDRAAGRPGGIGGGHESDAASGGRGMVKKEAGTSKDVSAVGDVRVKAEDGGYISSDEDGEGPGFRRMNIDNLVDLTADGDEDGEVGAFLPPVRVQRTEHKPRTLLAHGESAITSGGKIGSADLNDADAFMSSEKRRLKLKGKDFEITGEKHRYRGTYTDSSSSDIGDEDVTVKAEPTEDGGITDGAVQGGAIASPQLTGNDKDKGKARSSFSDVEVPAFQTKEEQREWEIQHRDRRILLGELGTPAGPATAAKPTVKEPNGDTAMARPHAAASDDPREGKVYLFQFPSVLPDLVPIVPKDEEEATAAAAADDPADAMDVDHPDGTGKGEASKYPPPGSRPPTLPSGCVGKLRIHASGRAYLDFGGVPMELGMAIEPSFLQDAVLFDVKAKNEGEESREDEEMKEEAEAEVTDGQEGGRAISMGQIKGKFVATPDWDKML